MSENQAPSDAHTYTKRTVIKTTVEQLINFHDRPDIFGKLAPPPIFTQVRDDQRSSLQAGDLHFTLWFGPIPIQWHARHQPGPTENSFADLMVSGPMKYWRHEHIFETVEGGAALVDRVTIAHKSGLAGIISRLAFDGVPLKILFFYRHWRTRWELERA